jgi:hypothetical protein
MMAESALKIPKFKIMGDALKVYNKVNGVAQEGATTQAAMMDFLQNNNDILRCFVEMLWQEQKPVVVGQLVWSPSLPNGVIAKVTQAGTFGADEPIWPSIVGSTVESGSAVLKIVLWAPETLPADGGTAALANNAEKLGGQLPAYYATATQLAAKAALLSPAFTGTPTAPTAAAGTNTDQIATTKFVMTALSALSSQGKIVSYDRVIIYIQQLDPTRITTDNRRPRNSYAAGIILHSINPDCCCIVVWCLNFKRNTFDRHF